MEDWIRVVRTGGLVVFTHQSPLWSHWEELQGQLEERKIWKKIWVLEPPMLFLPGLKIGNQNAPNKELFKVYVYQKL